MSVRVKMIDFGWTGEKVSEIGLGTWEFSYSWGVTDYNIAKSIIEAAYQAGINFVDTAIVYGDGLSEEFIGRAIKELEIRDELFIATKIPGQYLSRDDVFKAVELSLKRLNIRCIDLLQVHWPPCWHNIPTCEYADALEQLVMLGKVRYIGLSNYPVELIDSFRSCLSKIDIASIQIRYNLIERDAEKELIPYALADDIIVIAYSPLAKGALTGKYTPENIPEFKDVRAEDPIFHPENFKKIYRLVEELKRIAEKYNKTPAQTALNWLITSYPNIMPIPGAKSKEQVLENAGASGWRLEYEDWRRLSEVSNEIKISRVIY